MQWVRRSGASWMGMGRTVGLALCLVLVGSCSELAQTNRASSFLVILQLTGGTGAGDTAFQSDVQANSGAVFEDQGTLSVRLALKDAGPPGSPTRPTSANWITINRYRVVYVRTDGGAVPLPFEGAMTFTVIGSVGSASFVLVRLSAKLEPPLVNLRVGGGEITISTVAEITFFGRDQTGSEVTATGRISVTFADWAG